jgi:hypothetical protein
LATGEGVTSILLPPVVVGVGVIGIAVNTDASGVGVGLKLLDRLQAIMRNITPTAVPNLTHPGLFLKFITHFLPTV